MGHQTNGTPFPIAPSIVLAAVAAAYQLTPGDVTGGDGRTSLQVKEARRTLYVLLHQESWLSWEQVADHLKLARGGWVVRAARKANPQAVETLRAQIRPNGNQGQLFR